MEVKKVKPADLRVAEKYLLSFPLRPELGPGFEKRFPGFPALVVNRDLEIVFGIDYYCYLVMGEEATPLPGPEELPRMVAGDTREIEVLLGDFNDKDALFLNYNLKDNLAGLNLFEKLVFVRKALPLSGKREIYERTGLDININPELSERLGTLTGPGFKTALIDGHITLKSALRLCGFKGDSGKTLLELFERVPFTSSQQLKLLEMCEELVFREKVPLPEIFQNLGVMEMCVRERPQPDILDALFSFRYPEYAKKEAEWQAEVGALRLPGHIKISHAPFFEKKPLEIKIQLKDPGQLQKVLQSIDK